MWDLLQPSPSSELMYTNVSRALSCLSQCIRHRFKMTEQSNPGSAGVMMS